MKYILINEYGEISQVSDLTDEQLNGYSDTFHDIIRVGDGKLYINKEWVEASDIDYDCDGNKLKEED